MEKEQQLLEAFKKAGKAVSAKELSELSGIDKKEVDKLIKKLKDADKIDSPKRCYYQIK